MIMPSQIEQRLAANTIKTQERLDSFTVNQMINGDTNIGEIVKDESRPIQAIHNDAIRISKLINPNFYPVWNPVKYLGRRVYGYLLKGGRSSFKSSVVSLKAVKQFLQDDHGNVIIFRKVAKYLSTSVYEQIKWAIYTLGVEDEFTFFKSPLRIEHNRTGTAFYFYGVDDPVKIKSAKIAVGYPIMLWFEEAAEFTDKQEIDTVADTFIREDLPNGKQVELYFTYNPPRNPYVWINEWAAELEKDKNYIVHHSSYKDDKLGFLSKQFVEKVEEIRRTDPDYWAWMYDGQVIGLGDVVYNFNLFNVIPELPNDDRLLFADVAIDSGYSTSATTFLFIGFTVKGRVILLDTFYYSPVNKVRKKAPSEFSKDLHEFVVLNTTKYNINVDTYTIDSAEGALRNQYMLDYGTYLMPAKKKTKEKMIENVEDLLVQNRVYVLDTENNRIFLDEHRTYRWDEKTLKSPEPKVIKEDDHTVDAFQYYVNNNLSKLNLKV